MMMKILIINGVIISTILGVVYFSQQKNSETYAHDFYKNAVESNSVTKKADDWLNDTFYEKARQEAEKRGEIAKESVVETVETAKDSALDALWQATVGNAQRGISGLQQAVGNALDGGKEKVAEKISESFCPAK